MKVTVEVTFEVESVESTLSPKEMTANAARAAAELAVENNLVLATGGGLGHMSIDESVMHWVDGHGNVTIKLEGD